MSQSVIVREVHLNANVEWRRLVDVCPDMLPFALRMKETNGEEPMALSFTDGVANERHVFVFSEKGKQDLIEQLNSGIVPATAADLQRLREEASRAG